MKFTQVSDFELTTIDPITGGVWRVVSVHPLTETAAMLAIGVQLLREDKRPNVDSLLTIELNNTIKTD